MRLLSRLAVLSTFVLLCAFTCTSKPTASHNSPAVSPSAGATASPTSEASSSPTGGATSTPTSSPTSSPTGAALAITSLPFHGGEVGLGYPTVTLGASGGHAPYSWTINGGALPAGLSLSAGGQISGTPTGAGNAGFSVLVSDSAGGSASSAGSINIVPTMAVSQLCANLCTVEEGCTICGAFGGISGGQPPYGYTITNDNRPPGMGINGLTLTGAFPAPAGGLGQYGMTVQVHDAYGAQGTDTAQWFVIQHISFGGGVVGTPGPNCPWTGCTAQLPYSGGSSSVSASIKIVAYSNTCPFPPANGQCPLPEHTVSATAANGFVTITVTNSGLNRAQWGSNGWSGTLVVVLTDSMPCGPGNCNTGQVKVPITVTSG